MWSHKGTECLAAGLHFPQCLLENIWEGTNTFRSSYWHQAWPSGDNGCPNVLLYKDVAAISLVVIRCFLCTFRGIPCEKVSHENNTNVLRHYIQLILFFFKKIVFAKPYFICRLHAYISGILQLNEVGNATVSLINLFLNFHLLLQI